MRARAALVKPIQQRHRDNGAKYNGGRGGKYRADHGVFHVESGAVPAALRSLVALRRKDYQATKVIEEPFCAGLGPEKRRKADAVKSPEQEASALSPAVARLKSATWCPFVTRE